MNLLVVDCRFASLLSIVIVVVDYCCRLRCHYSLQIVVLLALRRRLLLIVFFFVMIVVGCIYVLMLLRVVIYRL